MSGASIWHAELAHPPHDRRIVASDCPGTIRDDRRHGDRAERQRWRNRTERERRPAPMCAGGLDGIAATLAAVERLPERYRGGLTHRPRSEVMLVVSMPQLRALRDRAIARDHPHRTVCVVRMEGPNPPWVTFYGLRFAGDRDGEGAFMAITATDSTWDDPHAHVARRARMSGLPLPDYVDEWDGAVVRAATADGAAERRLLPRPAPCDHAGARWRYAPSADAVVLACDRCGRGRIGCVPLHRILHVERTRGASALLRRDADSYLMRQAALDRAAGIPTCATIDELVARDGPAHATLDYRNARRPARQRTGRFGGNIRR